MSTGIYLLLPLISAVLISRKGGTGFLVQDGHWMVAGIEWFVALYAYMLFVTDRFPLDGPNRGARLHVLYPPFSFDSGRDKHATSLDHPLGLR